MFFFQLYWFQYAIYLTLESYPYIDCQRGLKASTMFSEGRPRLSHRNSTYHMIACDADIISVLDSMQTLVTFVGSTKLLAAIRPIVCAKRVSKYTYVIDNDLICYQM